MTYSWFFLSNRSRVKALPNIWLRLQELVDSQRNSSLEHLETQKCLWKIAGLMEDLFLGSQWSIILGYRRLSVKFSFFLIGFLLTLGPVLALGSPVDPTSSDLTLRVMPFSLLLVFLFLSLTSSVLFSFSSLRCNLSLLGREFVKL